MNNSAISSRRLVALLVLTAIGFMTLDARATGPFAGVRSFAFSATAPVRSTIGWVTSPISSAWNGAVHYDEVVAENDELRSRVSELEGALAQVADTESELRALQEATKVEFVEQYQKVTGQVISDRQTGLERIVEINLGSDDGLAVGMPVVTAKGLVGQIISVGGGRSAVRVLTDPRLRVGVISQRTRVVGVTAGNGDRSDLELDLLENAADGALDRVRFETSGFDNSSYPGGIPVGRLIESENGRVALRPSADLEHLSFLTVILYENETES